MYFVFVESRHGEEFIAAGESINNAITNLRNITEDYNPEDIQFFKAEPVRVKIDIRYTIMD